MLFTGDISKEVEQGISVRLQKAVGFHPKIDYLKVAHHGSRTASSESFLHTLMPEAALISAGRDNRYGHPHKETIEQLEKQDCYIWNTAQRGAVTIHF